MNQRELFLVSLTYDRGILTRPIGAAKDDYPSDWRTVDAYIAVSMASVDGDFARMFSVAAEAAVHMVIGDVPLGESPWYARVNSVKYLGEVGVPEGRSASTTSKALNSGPTKGALV